MGSTRAALVYETMAYDNRATHVRLSIWRHGRMVIRDAKPATDDTVFWFVRSSFTLRDLDGDGEPEVIIRLDSGGVHCCTTWRVYGYDAPHNAYRAVEHSWGDDSADPALRDLNGDGRPELVSFDGRFKGAFGLALGVMPIQIWSYAQHRFRDVTSHYPRRVRRQADELWNGWRSSVDSPNRQDISRGLLPAWVADEYLLGGRSMVIARLEAARRKGYLAGTARDAVAFIDGLTGFLRANGYAGQAVASKRPPPRPTWRARHNAARRALSQTEVFRFAFLTSV